MAHSTVRTREQRILDQVREHGFAGIDALAAQFGVTPQTVRRTVNLMCEQGLLRRIHGGVGPAVGVNLPYQRRQVMHLAAKQRIAAAVAAFVPHGASLFLGLGTTPAQVAHALRDHRDLRVITNSLNVLNALSDRADAELTFVGGTLRAGDLDVIGEAAAQTFAQFKTDFGVFGVGGVDDDGTLLDFHVGEVIARQAIARHCHRSLLVADVSKFGRQAIARGGTLADVDHLFVDAPLPADYQGLIADGRPRLHVAERFVEQEMR